MMKTRAAWTARLDALADRLAAEDEDHAAGASARKRPKGRSR